METLVWTAIGILIAVVFVLKAYAESCLHWRHPLNLFLNGDPSAIRKAKGDAGINDDIGDGGGCGD